MSDSCTTIERKMGGRNPFPVLLTSDEEKFLREIVASSFWSKSQTRRAEAVLGVANRERLCQVAAKIGYSVASIRRACRLFQKEGADGTRSEDGQAEEMRWPASARYRSPSSEAHGARKRHPSPTTESGSRSIQEALCPALHGRRFVVPKMAPVAYDRTQGCSATAQMTCRPWFFKAFLPFRLSVAAVAIGSSSARRNSYKLPVPRTAPSP
jgi:hypothetical protein